MNGFDWGSFLGGIVGAIGAFLAAYLTYWLPTRRVKKRHRIEIELACAAIFSRAQFRIDQDGRGTVDTLQHLLRVELMEPIATMLGRAAESNRFIFDSLRTLYLGIHYTLGNEIPKEHLSDATFLKSSASAHIANRLADKINTMISNTAKTLKLGETWPSSNS